MSGIPCDHSCAVMQSIGQNVAEFADEWFIFSKQNLIYNGEFCGIELHDLPTIDDDGLVRTLTSDISFSLKPPRTKRPPGRLRKKRIESQFQDKRTVYCSRCNVVGHNRVTCKNPLP